MTPKQRMLTAVKGGRPDDRVPTWEVEFQHFEAATGRAPTLGYAFEALSEGQKRRAVYENAEIFVETCEKCAFDAFSLMDGYWEAAPGVPAMYWIADERWRLEHARAFKRIAGDTYALAAFAEASLCIPSGEEILSFSYDMVDDPEAIERRSEATLRGGIEKGLRLLDAGADLLVSASDIAINTGAFFSPAQMQRFFYPYFTRWNRAFADVPTVLHTDGNVMLLLDDLAECGFGALQCIDPMAGMDLRAVREKLRGRMAVAGNVNLAALDTLDAAAAEAEAERVLREKEPGGLIFGCCNAVFTALPYENYRALLRRRDQLSQYA